MLAKRFYSSFVDEGSPSVPAAVQGLQKAWDEAPHIFRYKKCDWEADSRPSEALQEARGSCRFLDLVSLPDIKITAAGS